MKILVWDLPTRLFHWLLAASFAVAYLSAEEANWLAVHVFAGYLMLGLLAFRLVWGFVGGRYARFSSFRFSLKEGFGYLQQVLAGTARRHLGHNPAGSWAVYLLLALAFLAGSSGLFTLAGQEGQGPLAAWVPYASSKAFREIHEAAANAMLAMVILHLAGVALESWRHRENLAQAMLTGSKEGPPEAAISSKRLFSALLLLAAVAAGGLWYFGSAAVAAREGNAGYKIMRSIDPRETPLRITETPYWKGKHRHIAASVWRSPTVGTRANCVACHHNAERGIFVGSAMPREVAAKVALR
ncbi:MAG: cytochrome b/b6 domain-containing protein [Sulfurimicrobium sp.]